MFSTFFVHFFSDVSLWVKEVGHVGDEHLNRISCQQKYEMAFINQNSTCHPN